MNRSRVEMLVPISPKMSPAIFLFRPVATNREAAAAPVVCLAEFRPFKQPLVPKTNLRKNCIFSSSFRLTRSLLLAGSMCPQWVQRGSSKQQWGRFPEKLAGT
jgi:hypothetical protein